MTLLDERRSSVHAIYATKTTKVVKKKRRKTRKTFLKYKKLVDNEHADFPKFI